MGDDDRIEVSLEGDVLIFRELERFARALSGRGWQLHVVGGMAVTIWGRFLGCPRPGMTGDIDSVITSAVLQGDVARYGRDLSAILSELGYRRPEDWRNSRTGRFRYKGDHEVAFELLCGTPAVGRPSGTPPAHRLHQDPETKEAIYAARTPWLDLISEWTQVDAARERQTFHFHVPSLPCLMALKIGAVADKQARLDEVRAHPRNEREVPYERSRLALHSADVVLVREMLERTGALPELIRLCTKHPEVREAGQVAADWFDDHDEDRAAVSTLQPDLEGSPDPLQRALRI